MKNIPNFTKASLGTQKGFAPILLILLVVVLVGGGIYVYKEINKPKINDTQLFNEKNTFDNKITEEKSLPVTKEKTSNNEVVGHCGFVINSHKPNVLVDWPIIINGKVAQQKTGYDCFWQTFEGVSGSAQLYAYEDEIWKPIGNSLIFGPDFSLNFNFPEVGLKMNNSIKIIFTEENPAVQRPSITFELPLVLK